MQKHNHSSGRYLKKAEQKKTVGFWKAFGNFGSAVFGTVLTVGLMAAMFLYMGGTGGTQQGVAKMAITDGLTGLNNRAETERQITEELSSLQGVMDAGRKENSYLIMIDLDDFKQVNDVYGHQEGDEVLRGVSRVFQEVTGGREIKASIGRWGGEEFMILLRDIPSDAEAIAIADKIREAFAGITFAVSGHHTLSAGVARLHPGETPDEAIHRADDRLYSAKGSGKNRTVWT